MCSPKIAEVVRERIAQEGRPSVSRRNFLRLGGMTAAGLAVASAGLPMRVSRAQEMMSEIIELSHVFGPNMATYTPGEAPTVEPMVTVEANGFYIQRWNFPEHCGTHMDIPAHFIADGETVDNYAPSSFFSPAVVIDISEKAASDDDAMLELADIEAWEAANGEIPAGAVVAMYSGWDSRWSDLEAFRNADADGAQHYPGFSGEAAQFLVSERDIHGIAVDTLSLDIGASTTFDVHVTILGAGKFGLENVANLGSMVGRSATIISLPPRYEAGSGGPCRIVAMA
jgi:kynurenine formamidase